MSTLHPTTAALLTRLRAADVQSGAHRAWLDAGCPDAPEPRFVPTEPGVYHRKDEEHPVMVTRGKTYAALVGGVPVNRDVTDDGLWLGPVAPWREPLKPGEFLDGVVKHLAPSPGAADVAAYSADRREIMLHISTAIPDPPPHPDPGPCPPKPRTAEEARANPMPGDRWQEPGGRWYVVVRRSDSKPHPWVVRWDTGAPGAYGLDLIGEPGETYLGNFPLETP